MFDVATSDGITADLDRLSSRLRAANVAMGREVAQVARRAQTEAARNLRGRLTLSGMRVRLAVGVRTFAGAQVSTVVVTPKPAGPWVIVEEGTRGHAIRPRNRRALTAGDDVYARVEVSGVAGRGTWSRATDAAAPIIDQAVTELYDRALEV